MVEMGIFTALAFFLKPLMKLGYLLLHIRMYILCFFLIVMDDKGNFGFVFPPIYIYVKPEAMA